MILDSDFSLDRYGLHVRLVNEEDAAYIVSLRSDLRLGRFLNETVNDRGLSTIEFTYKKAKPLYGKA